MSCGCGCSPCNCDSTSQIFYGKCCEGQKTILQTSADQTLSSNIDQVDVVDSAVTLTLPQSPRYGDQVLVNAVSGVATITGGDCTDIVGGDVTVPIGSAALMTFTSAGLWVVLLGAAHAPS